MKGYFKNKHWNPEESLITIKDRLITEWNLVKIQIGVIGKTSFLYNSWVMNYIMYRLDQYLKFIQSTCHADLKLRTFSPNVIGD